jgi:hypothetical protein
LNSNGMSGAHSNSVVTVRTWLCAYHERRSAESARNVSRAAPL